jgi:modulator of FtsH protease HflC
VRLHDERSAQSRLEDILGSETRNSTAKHDLIEIVRADRNRQPLRDESLKGGPTGAIGVLPPIEFGRQKIEAGKLRPLLRKKTGPIRHCRARFPDQPS